jgi:hypothetical protein
MENVATSTMFRQRNDKVEESNNLLEVFQIMRQMQPGKEHLELTVIRIEESRTHKG